MKITGVETLQADAGWRMFSFLKVTTSDGIVGWSEFNESFGSTGLSDVIKGLAPILIGRDPLPFEQVTQHLHVLTRQSRGGLNQQAIAAIENALLDVAGKAYGVPVAALFGGPIRERIPVYWSHFGTYRVRSSALMGVPPLATYDDLARHAQEVRDRGFRALKTNILPLVDGRLASYVPGFGRTPGWPELNWDNRLTRGVTEQLSIIREAVGPDMGIHLDVNFNFKTEGYKRIADVVAGANLTWLEIDTHDALALAEIKRGAPCPIDPAKRCMDGGSSSRSLTTTRPMWRSWMSSGTGCWSRRRSPRWRMCTRSTWRRTISTGICAAPSAQRSAP
jgi:galactonate dehydratase